MEIIINWLLGVAVIDQQGFRENVAIVILNRYNQVFWGRRIKQISWQFPQGGLNSGETAIRAMYRELQEEVGLVSNDVEIITSTKDWFYYRFPRFLIRKNYPLCVGQKQKWFLIKLLSPDNAINLRANKKPEFDNWLWVNYWYPVDKIVSFKKYVYKKVLTYFLPFVGKD